MLYIRRTYSPVLPANRCIAAFSFPRSLNSIDIPLVIMCFSCAVLGVHPSGSDSTNDFVRPSFLPPVALAFIRAMISLYCFTTIVVCYSWLAHNTSKTTLQDVNISSYSLETGSAGIGQSFSFFTYITFWSLWFYFLLSSIHTFFYALQRPTWLHRWPKILQLPHSLYYTSIITLTFLG
jgi:hypothetical protein